MSMTNKEHADRANERKVTAAKVIDAEAAERARTEHEQEANDAAMWDRIEGAK